MEYYNYLEAMEQDVKDYIAANLKGDLFEDREEMENKLNEVLWANDDVTGNASGSYYCNSSKAKEAVLGDPSSEDYTKWMIGDFGIDADELTKHLFDWEYWDVSIRCYLLGQVIGSVLDGMEQDGSLFDYIEQA